MCKYCVNTIPGTTVLVPVPGTVVDDVLSSLLRTFVFFSNFPLFPTLPGIDDIFYLARNVIAAHLEQLQLVPNLLKIFETPSSVFVQLG